MVATAKSERKLVRGDQWDFGPVSHSVDDVPVDLTGCTIKAALDWATGTLPIETEIGDDDDATGFFWVDQGGGQYAIRVSEADSAAVPKGQLVKLVLAIVDSLGRKRTKGVLILDLVSP